MVALLALGLGLFTTAVGAYLGWNTMQANRALDQARALAQTQADAVGGALETIQRGLASEEVVAAARAERQEGGSRDALIDRLRESGIRNVLYLVNARPPLETTDLDDLPGGGFAALSMLLEAGETGRAPAQAHFAGTPDEYLALAQRFGDNEDVVVLWVAVPMTVVTNVLERPDGVDGLALRQRGSGAPIVLQDTGLGVPQGAEAIEIPGSRFELAWHHSQVLGPMSTGQLGGLFGAGVLMLILSGLMLQRTGAEDATGVRGEDARSRSGIRPGHDPESTRPSPTAEVAATGAVDRQDDSASDAEASGIDGESTPRDRDEPPSRPEDHEQALESAPTGEGESRDDLTADGEPRRAAGPSQALDAPELADAAEADETVDDAGADDASAQASGDRPADQPVDEATGGPTDEPSGEPTEESIKEPVDEQAEMGEMLRALIDNGDAGADADIEPGGHSSDDTTDGTTGDSADRGSKRAADASNIQPTAVPDSSIFRAYDIRGVVGDTLDESVAESIGRAIGSEANERGLTRIAIARDGRLSGAQMLAAVSRGLARSGLEVIDVGAVPTPVLYYAAQEIGGGSGVMVTGSHNPPDYNGFKIVLGGETLAGDSIRDLHTRLVEGRLVDGEGQLGEQRITSRYIERIGTDIQLEKSLKVVVDCGNGIAGAVAPRLLESIGADVIPLYAEVDGSFPNHHPDPGDPKTLEDLRLCVRNFEADVGIAFDGDGDRLGVVAPNGEIIYPDRVMMLFARDVLERTPGAEIIYDVKCTGLLAEDIESAGGKPVMARTGHSFIKAEIKQRGAPLAGEMSGHFFFGERWYGFDDGLYSAARLLEILAADTRAPGQIFAELPTAVSTPELKVEMKEGEAHAFVAGFADKAEFEGATISTIDGVRADFADGFGLVRASNTTPVLVLRFEGETKDALARIQGEFRDAMLALNPALKLPF